MRQSVEGPRHIERVDGVLFTKLCYPFLFCKFLHKRPAFGTKFFGKLTGGVRPRPCFSVEQIYSEIEIPREGDPEEVGQDQVSGPFVHLAEESEGGQNRQPQGDEPKEGE